MLYNWVTSAILGVRVWVEAQRAKDPSQGLEPCQAFGLAFWAASLAPYFIFSKSSTPFCSVYICIFFPHSICLQALGLLPEKLCYSEHRHAQVIVWNLNVCLLARHPGVESLGNLLVLFFPFWHLLGLFSPKARLIYMSTPGAWAPPILLNPASNASFWSFPCRSPLTGVGDLSLWF